MNVSAVIGANVWNLRVAGRATQKELAEAARHAGLAWADTRVSELEHGRMNVSVNNLPAIISALRAATGIDVTIADLLKGTGL